MLCIPYEVAENEDLSIQAKFLYGYILASTNSPFECDDTNDCLSKFCGVKPRAIQLWIKALLESGYISIRYTDDAQLKRKHRRNSSIRVLTPLIGMEYSEQMGALAFAEFSDSHLGFKEWVSDTEDMQSDITDGIEGAE
jgi:hypothetical protein